MTKQQGDRRLQLVFGVLRLLRLERPARRLLTPNVTLALFNLFNGGLSTALLATLAMSTGSAFIFPSLGATAFLLFYAPLAPPAAPRNVIIGHTLGAGIGWLSLVAFGLLDHPPVTHGIDPIQVTAAALALGGTSCLMVLLRVVHPPASATALIVAFGLMPNINRLPILIAAVGLLVLQAFIMNRLAGVPYPLWGPPSGSQARH